MCLQQEQFTLIFNDSYFLCALLYSELYNTFQCLPQWNLKSLPVYKTHVCKNLNYSTASLAEWYHIEPCFIHQPQAWLFKKILPSCLKQQKNPLCQSFALYTVAHRKDLGLDKCIFMEVCVDIVSESCCKLVFRNRMTMAMFSAQRMQLFSPDQKSFL